MKGWRSISSFKHLISYTYQRGRCCEPRTTDLSRQLSTSHQKFLHPSFLASDDRKTAVMASSGLRRDRNIVAQDYDYFLVLDFEATCLENEKIHPQEVIELPVLKVSGKTFETESTFHQYVEPQVHGVGDFCTKLTGITPEMVKGQPTFAETLKLLNDWMLREGLLDPAVKSIFVTCGDWDLKTMLPSQCGYFEIPYGSYFRQWINIKKSFAVVTGHFPKGMMQMLEKLHLEHVGRHHSGIDDCRNIANILRALAQKRFKFKQTGKR
ncbi:ERI1 exoribonuclease 3-like isoform X1 [Diadema antillarum]|uniref:ERI1 exoribonuclease 3-like isoform X1 n=2 Tax=Diadema antillarum TaxID=105358 RepID=UPI003A87AEA6